MSASPPFFSASPTEGSDLSDGPRSPLAAASARALGAEGPFAATQESFAVRSGQIELAGEVAEAIAHSRSLIAEAGTGTGKTYAYLVPALLSGGRIILSTGTRNLQDQLFDRDVPAVKAALGVLADVAILKGRSNYLCLHHLKRNLNEGRFASRDDIVALRRIERFAQTAQRGDRSELADVPEDAPAWQHATSTRENCLGQECADYDRCFVIKARQAAQRAEIVVVNHHLFCADLALRDEGIAELLPTTDAVLFDEAHQLPEIATGFFGTAVSTRKLSEFVRDLQRAGYEEARDAADWLSLGAAFEQRLRELRRVAGNPARLDAEAVAALPGLLESVHDCLRELGVLGAVLDRCSERGRELAKLKERCTELQRQMSDWLELAVPEPRAPTEDAFAPAAPAESGASSLSATVDVPVDAPAVRWIDVHAQGLTLHATPLSVAPVFSRHRDARPRAWVFLSATLAIGDDLGHFARQLGLEQARQKVWQSPFDYPSQALLVVPQGIGAPSGPDFAQRVFDTTWPLIEANAGRAFVLCTSLRMVEALAQRLRDATRRHDIAFEILEQGTGSRAELLERFRRGRAPVLIGAASFWEGVDVPGQQLSLVIIDKLPFAPPDDPVLAARLNEARREGLDGFRSLQLPAAAMALKQGAGRLIRSETDRGVLVVCDSRLAEKAYGRTLLRSLPPFRRTRSVADALAFLTQG